MRVDQCLDGPQAKNPSRKKQPLKPADSAVTSHHHLCGPTIHVLLGGFI